MQTNTCKQDQEMESSEESVFLGSGASWVLAFSCRNLGREILSVKKTGRHSRIFFFGGHESSELPKYSFVFVVTWNCVHRKGARAAG